METNLTCKKSELPVIGEVWEQNGGNRRVKRMRYLDTKNSGDAITEIFLRHGVLSGCCFSLKKNRVSQKSQELNGMGYCSRNGCERKVTFTYGITEAEDVVVKFVATGKQNHDENETLQTRNGAEG